MSTVLPLVRDPRRAVFTGLVLLALSALAVLGGNGLLAQIAGDRGIALAAAALAVFGGKALWAQIAGDRGIAAVAASGDIQVGGVEVDVTAKTGEEAREQGWREAMKLAWKKIDGPAISDAQLYSLVSSVVVESEELQLRTAEQLKIIADRLGIHFIFKSSFDKANRSSDKSYRGPGLDEGLKILAKVRNEVGVPVLTDVHDIPQIAPVADVVDVLQTPAFLARQTDFIHAVAASGKPVNIKKAQFMAPHDMANVVDKARSAAGAAGVDTDTIMVCERGVSFGYNNLVSDMRSLVIMRETGCPVVFDATHSVQLPGGQGTRSGGQREFVPVLARSAIAAGVSGLFMETHPDPANAKSDGPNAWPLDRMESLLQTLVALDRTVKERGFEEARL